MESKLELTFVYDNEIKGYRVRNFEETFEGIKHWADTYSLSTLQILNDDDAKLVKKARTELRKKITAIADARKQVNRLIIGEFNEQATAIEKYLKAEDDRMKANLDAYADSKKAPEPEVCKVAIYSIDKNAIEKVKAYAQSLGCQIQEL